MAAAFDYTYKYDRNGNLFSREKAGDQSGATWTGFDKPRTMWRVMPSKVAGSEFHYNAARSRVMQLEFDAVSGTFPVQVPTHYNRKRIYALGSTLELNYNNAIVSGTGTDWKLNTVRIYVPGPDGIIGSREFTIMPITGATSEQKYVYHYDHLGSIAALSDWGSTAGYSIATGSKTGRYSEDAWGQRRDPLDWNGAVPTSADDGGFDSLTPRGFTGHEMLDDLGLVHMNGRIYDPLLGKFLSADLLVSNPRNLQSYNRFSYVGNNPLSTTDPTGFESKEDEERRRNAENAARRAIIGERGVLGYIVAGESAQRAISMAGASAVSGAALRLEASDIKAGPGDTIAATAPAAEAKGDGLKHSPMPDALAKRLSKDATGRRVMDRLRKSDVMVFSGNTNELGRSPGIERTQGRSLPPKAMELLGLSAKYGMVIDVEQIQSLAGAKGLNPIDVMRDVVVNETIPILLKDDADYQAMSSQEKQIHELKQDKGVNPELRRAAEKTAREPGSVYNPRVDKATGREIGPSGLPVNPSPSELQLPSDAVLWDIPR